MLRDTRIDNDLPDGGDYIPPSLPDETPVPAPVEVPHRRKKIALLWAVILIGVIVIVRASLPL